MSTRKFMRTRMLRPGMRIDQTIVDQLGRVLIEKGVFLDDYMIEALLEMGVMSIYIREGEDDIEEEEQIAPSVVRVIEQEKVPDQAKVSLSEVVKKRVATGIQYLYNDTEADNFVEYTRSITDDLIKAIEDNDAIAIDIGMLKISDEYTFKHSVDVATMSMIIAKRYGMSAQEVYELGLAGLLHDIGKSKIPNEILNKAGRLTEEEFEIMKQHSVYGYRIAKEKKGISEAMLMGILQHHEKLDGSGYPMGAADSQIHLYARIIAVADIYDALVTERPYKSAFSPRSAVEMLMAMTKELDHEVLRSFLDSVILHSVGSTVLLSNGERAKVVENVPGNAMRPKVVGIKSGKIYDLSRDISCANIVIE